MILYFILGFLFAIFLIMLVTLFILSRRLKDAEGNIIKMIEVINTHTNTINNINNIIDKQNPEFFIK